MRTLRILLALFMVSSVFLGSLSVEAVSSYPVEWSFTTTVVSAGQVWRGEIKARATIQIGDANGSMPFFDGPNATNTCGARYSYFLGTNQTVIYDCVSPTYTDLATRRTSNNFILVDAYSRNPPVWGFGPDVYTLRTPTEIASAIAALGTNGDYSLSANGRQISYTRIAPETDPNGSTISPVQLSHGAQYLSHVTSASSAGYPAVASTYSQVDFTPTNVGSGETYEMSISVYIRDQFSLGYNLFDTKAYTATGTTVDDITSRIVAEYNTILYPIPSDPNWVVPLRVHPAINCVDNTTKITCTSNDYAVSIVGSSRVIYSTPDTTNPTISLLGTNPEIVTYGTVYADAGANWTDNRDGAGTILATSGSIDTAVRGIYTLEYTKIDNAWNTGSVIRTVYVRDTTPPVITVLGSGSVTQELDLPYTDAGATWSDDVDGSGTLTASGISLMTGRGTYTLTYEKIDAAGNIGTGSRDVTIVDTIAPVVTLTTLPVTIDASIYQISGRAPWSNFIDVYSGATLLVSTTPVDGYFSVFVPLAPSSVNTFLIEATDTGRNTGTGQVVITTSSASSGFTGAFQVSGSTLSGVTTFSGASFSVATQVTVQAPVFFTSSSGGLSVIPTGTIITGASGTVFDASAINTLSVVVTSGLASNQVSNGALEFGISGTGLYFSRPIKIQIPVSGYSGTTIPVRVKHGGMSTYVISGLTNNPNSTCTNGVSSSPSAIATVSGGFATIYTCAASTFVAYTETAVVSSGGGGGGGSLSVYTTVAPTVPTTSAVNPSTNSGSLYTIITGASTLASKKWFSIEIIPASVSRLTRVATIVVPTTLREGSRVRVTLMTKDKKNKITLVLKVKNGTITWKTKKTGIYQITPIGK